jgi:hypothetical protein
MPPYLLFVDPSSLVFAAIVGVWAAYLIPHWLRHRDQFIHSPDDDRDSERLRVLSRRAPAVSVPAHSGGPVLTTAPPTALLPAVPAPAKPSRRVRRPVRPVRAARSAARVAARRRARVLLLLIAATVAAWAAVGLTAAPWVMGAALTGLLLIDMAALRAAAVHRAAARRRARRADASTRSTAGASRTAARMPARAASAAPGADQPAARAATLDDRSDTWVPVPVPPPVYTLKPVAHRPEPPALQPVERPAAVARNAGMRPSIGQPLEPLPQLDLDAALDRRRAVNL